MGQWLVDGEVGTYFYKSMYVQPAIKVFFVEVFFGGDKGVRGKKGGEFGVLLRHEVELCPT